jgi:hypothetical protein
MQFRGFFVCVCLKESAVIIETITSCEAGGGQDSPAPALMAEPASWADQLTVAS